MKDENKRIQMRGIPAKNDYGITVYYLVEWRFEPSQLNLFQRIFNFWRPLKRAERGRLIQKECFSIGAFENCKSKFTIYKDILEHNAFNKHVINEYNANKRGRILY